MPDLNLVDISHCHRIGSFMGDEHRVVMIKFKQMLVRNLVWFAKTKLKGYQMYYNL